MPAASVESEYGPRPSGIVAGLAIGLGLLWAYWPLLLRMSEKWESSPEYSHGWLVPLFALMILWTRRPQKQTTRLGIVGLVLLGAAIALGFLAPAGLTWLVVAIGVTGATLLWMDWSGGERPRPDWWGGLFFLLGGVALQLVAAHYYMEWFEQLALLPVLLGCVLLLQGRDAVRWCWPAIAFLFFMVPLPYTLEVAMRGPLRDLGTASGTYVLQTLGMPAYAEGNVIVVDEVRIGVVEACSGLRMLMVFFAIATAFALLVERPLWQKTLILLGAVPIAIVSNIVRLTVTALCYAQGWDDLADLVFHDLAGWLMMPLGLALLWLELWSLDHLIIVEEDRPLAPGLPMQTQAADANNTSREEELATSGTTT